MQIGANNTANFAGGQQIKMSYIDLLNRKTDQELEQEAENIIADFLKQANNSGGDEYGS